MGQQKYKIYINGKPVFLTIPAGVNELGYKPGKTVYVAPYLGKKMLLKQYLDLLEKNRDVEAVVLYSNDLTGLWNDFKACFKVLEAAGGYVRNADNQILVFYRRGSWDMPKGKIDPGETPEQASLREVREETGLVHLTLGTFLAHTYHTYREKGHAILKDTWWYDMHTTDREVVPQTEEDIEEIRWVEPRAWLAGEPVVYNNIRDVIEAGLQTSRTV
ncbi:MAG: NUDIX domain-containing protein [Lewinellaceae bacterium]|jgi:8-oxo-dGTP pyrophosphatase MutT (NUDIX family)|nr:NUDIX domain-containing protein [Lewinellaceae bacterium]